MPNFTDFSTSGIITPAAHATAITPADADLSSGIYTRAIYVGGTGDLTVMMAGDEGDSIVTFAAVPAGSILPMIVKQIRASNSTATFIVAIW